MTESARAPEPRVEALLAAAHRHLDLLRERCGALERCGLARDHLPSDTGLEAFALLGEHAREDLVAQLNSQWGSLHAKGLIRGGLEAAPTPLLRLLVHALPHAQAIGSIREQLQRATGADSAPPGVWTAPAAVRGPWGRSVRLHFAVAGADYLMIDPDRVFGLQPAVLALDPASRHTGSFAFPLDDGEIKIMLRHRDGRVYCQKVRSMIDKEEQAW